MKAYLAAMGILAGTLAISCFAEVPQDKVVFLDIGQGDSTLFQEQTTQILIDGGPGAQVLERLGEEMPWFDRTVDVVILTHPQQDHLEGLLHVLDRYHVGLVLFPQAAYASQLQSAWLQMLIDRHIPYRFAWAGESLTAGDLRVRVLAPFPDAEDQALIRKNVNEASTTTRVDFSGLSLLLSGDAERAAEHLLVQRTDPRLLDVVVLKAGHHGSKTSTTPELLKATTPGAVVISVGAHNRYGHPSPITLEHLKGIPTWRTDEHGSVRFLYNTGKWFVD